MPDLTPKKLSRSVSVGFDRMRHFRQARLKFLNQYTTRFYGTRSGELDDQRAYPVNMIYTAATTMVPNLVYSQPRARVTGEFLAYRDYANISELALNHLIEEIDLRQTLRMAITDAIFLCGWIKTGITVSGRTLDIGGELHDLGQPYADRVDPDDMVVDPTAKSLEEAYYIGNRYSVAKEMLLETGMIKSEDVERLRSRYDFAPQYPEASLMSYRSDTLAWVKDNQGEGPVELVDLVDLWVPSRNMVYTIPYYPDRGSDKFLHEADYLGFEGGPYHQLGFAFVPDNIMPVAPAMVWYDLDQMVNKIARKIARQADRQKTVLAYEESAWEDAKRMIDGSDGESVAVQDVDRIKEINLGGAVDDGYKFFEWAKSNFAEMAMNLDLLSGSGSSEPTATQAEMVNANTSVRLADMQNMVYDFAGDVMRDLFKFLHTDPLIEIPLIQRTAQGDAQVFYTPEMREGDWVDYNIKIVPYSMGRQDPNLKVRRLMEFAGNVIPALANASMMLGPAFNIEAALTIMGREMGVDYLEDIINTQSLTMMMQRMQQALEAGIPLDQKIIRSIMNPTQANAIPAQLGAGGGFMQPNQPNPMGALPSGIDTQTERNMRHQDTGAELQSTYAQARGGSRGGGGGY